MTRLVLVGDEEGVRTLTLNRPEKLNALSAELVESLSAELLHAAVDPNVRVIVIAGAGRSFCAGYDLGEESPAEASTIADVLHHSLDRLLEVFDQPQPVIAQVQGHCLGGGCDLMMMCDLAVASEGAVFGQPEIRFGSAVVAHVMPWLVGARRAKELLFTGFDRMDAGTALSYGLLNRVVPTDDLREETLRVARELAAVDPSVMRLSKKAVNTGWEHAGFRSALRAALDLGVMIETKPAPERAAFDRIVRERGLREAIRWRDERFPT